MAATEKKKKVVEVYESEEDMAVSLAKYVADLSAKFAKERGSFTVLLSGGTLMVSLRKLMEPPYIESIEWSKWHVLWVDERVVPKDHVDSNYKLALDGFLSKVPINPGNVYAINDALAAEDAAEDYETRLKHLVETKVVEKSSVTGFPKFDLILLGMGPDGHVASLFPGHELVKENKKWVTLPSLRIHQNRLRSGLLSLSLLLTRLRISLFRFSVQLKLMQCKKHWKMIKIPTSFCLFKWFQLKRN